MRPATNGNGVRINPKMDDMIAIGIMLPALIRKLLTRIMPRS